MKKDKKASSDTEQNCEAVNGSRDTLLIDSSCEYDRGSALLSVVIPVYNVEKYISVCLESVLKQTYSNIEIICVDDASPANEGDIIREYCKNDGRIKYVRHAKNEGLFQARITGMKYASGDYFAFLDSDDHLSVDYYRVLMKKITEENADIVIGDFVDEYEDGRIEYYNFDNFRFRDIDLRGECVYDTFMRQQGLWFGWHTVWNKIYKKHIWTSALPYVSRFSDSHGHLIMTEDIAYSCTFWRFADRIVNAHDSYYYYYHHSGQSVAAGNLDKFTKNVNDVAAVFKYFKEFLIGQKLFDKYKDDYEKFFSLYIEFWTGNARAVIGDDKIKAEKIVKELFGRVVESNYKDHYHYSCRTSIAPFEWYDDIKKVIASPDVEIVSFDIFDTLVVRPFFLPSDIFALMNEKFNETVKSTAFIDFKKIRINVEAELRSSLSKAEEITLENIYDKISEIFELDSGQKRTLMEYEIGLELKFIRPRRCGRELYELARYLKKRVIFVSDIYLPSDVIRKMLSKCGYEPDGLYLSCDYLMTKGTGNLFKAMLKNEKVPPENIVHIGDNWNSDVVSAQSQGIRAHHLSSPVAQFRGENGGLYSGGSFYKIFAPNGKQYMGENAAEFLGIRCMLAMAANKAFDNPYTNPFDPKTDFNANPYFIGYYALGMHLYAVTDWIRKIVKRENRRRVHFVSRDGYLPMRAWEIMNALRKENLDYSYLHISRKASALLQADSIAGVEAYINSFGSYNISIKTPADTFSVLAGDEMKNDFPLLSEHGKKTKGFSEAMELGKTLFNDYLDRSKAEDFKKKAAEYFSSQIAENDIIFDLGYRANKEYILSSLIGRPVDCLYIYSNESNALERAIANGFELRTFYDYTPTALAAARELMFSEAAPSCVGYDCEKDMAPIFDSEYSEHYFNQFVIDSMQEGALDFISDFESTFSGTVVTQLYRKFDASLPFEFFMNYSSERDRSVFGCVTFEDDTFAGEPSKLIDDWNAAVRYHKLDIDPCQNASVQTENGAAEIAGGHSKDSIYADGLLVKTFEWLNREYPMGSKKRERLKKLIGLFVK